MTNVRHFKPIIVVFSFKMYHISNKICLISPGTDLPGEWPLLALGSVPGLLRQILICNPSDDLLFFSFAIA